MEVNELVKCKIEAFASLVSQRLTYVAPDYKADIGMLVVAIPTDVMFDVAHCDECDARGMLEALEELDGHIADIINGVEWMNTHKEVTTDE